MKVLGKCMSYGFYKLRGSVFITWFIVASAVASPQPLDKTVVLVNDSVITEQELQTELQAIRQQMRASNMRIPPAQELRDEILQRLIDQELQMQIARRIDMDIDPQELNSAIEDIAARNNMSLQQMRAEVEKQGTSFAEYRESIRREMLIAMMQQRAVAAEINITDRQVEDYLENYRDHVKTEQEYHVQNILIPLASHANEEEISQAQAAAKDILAQIAAGADFNQWQPGNLGWRQINSFPSVFIDTIATMEVGDVKGPVRAGNGLHLLKVTEVRGGELDTTVTLTHARHILLQPDENMSEMEVLEKLTTIRQAVLDGECFSRYARDYSQDPGSGERGGDLGWVGPGELVPPFEQAMDTLALGGISEPVQTQFGYHLIQVLDRKQEDAKELLKGQTHQMLFRARFEEGLATWLQELRAQAYIEIIEPS